MLDGRLLVIGNSLGIVLLLFLVARAKPTPKSGDPGFENEVQDIMGCQMRRTKINFHSEALYGLSCVKKSFKGQVCC